MIRHTLRLPLVGLGGLPLSGVKTLKPKPSLEEKNISSLPASYASRWSASELRNIIGKETHRPTTSPTVSGSSFNEKMLRRRGSPHLAPLHPGIEDRTNA